MLGALLGLGRSFAGKAIEAVKSPFLSNEYGIGRNAGSAVVAGLHPERTTGGQVTELHDRVQAREDLKGSTITQKVGGTIAGFPAFLLGAVEGLTSPATHVVTELGRGAVANVKPSPAPAPAATSRFEFEQSYARTTAAPPVRHEFEQSYGRATAAPPAAPVRHEFEQSYARTVATPSMPAFEPYTDPVTGIIHYAPDDFGLPARTRADGTIEAARRTRSMQDVNAYLGRAADAITSPTGRAVAAGAGGLILGAAGGALLGRMTSGDGDQGPASSGGTRRTTTTRRRSSTKRRSSKKRTSKHRASGRSRKSAPRRKTSKRSPRTHQGKRIYRTKNGQPYVKMANGKARFISKRAAKTPG